MSAHNCVSHHICDCHAALLKHHRERGGELEGEIRTLREVVVAAEALLGTPGCSGLSELSRLSERIDMWHDTKFLGTEDDEREFGDVVERAVRRARAEAPARMIDGPAPSPEEVRERREERLRREWGDSYGGSDPEGDKRRKE